MANALVNRTSTGLSIGETALMQAVARITSEVSFRADDGTVASINIDQLLDAVASFDREDEVFIHPQDADAAIVNAIAAKLEFRVRLNNDGIDPRNAALVRAIHLAVGLGVTTPETLMGDMVLIARTVGEYFAAEGVSPTNAIYAALRAVDKVSASRRSA